MKPRQPDTRCQCLIDESLDAESPPGRSESATDERTDEMHHNTPSTFTPIMCMDMPCFRVVHLCTDTSL